MSSIRREMVIEARPHDVWAAVRDVGAPHKRLAPGFLVDTRLDDGVRVVTFANGPVARELIVDVDDGARRLAWAVTGSSRLAHYNASIEVLELGDGSSCFVWTADLLPHTAPGDVVALIDQAMVVIKGTLEGQ